MGHHSRAFAAVGLLAVVSAVLASCASSGHPAAVNVSPKPSLSPPSASPSPARANVVRHVTPHPTVVRRAPFTSSVESVTAADLPHSWHQGCPVSPAQLRAVRLTYFGFDGEAHTGTLIVNAAVTGTVRSVFRTLYDNRFPIRRMQPVDAYGGDDNASMAADNTSSFNCRAAVSSGPKHWSMHAYGEAIDVNTVENPYIFKGSVLPPNGAAYAERSDERPGMATPHGTLVRAFKAQGWGWGGDFSGGKDYQHFSTNGK